MRQEKVSPDILAAAIEGYEAQKVRIDAKIAELKGLLDGRTPELITAPQEEPVRRRALSAAARKRMREAQLRRWAKVRGESGSPSTAKAPKRKRRLSAEGRRRIIEATKRRWALARAARAAETGTASKKSAAKKTAAKKSAAKRAVAKKAATTTPVTTAAV